VLVRQRQEIQALPRSLTLTQSPTRILAWEGCFNVRDLGGLPTSDGRHIRWGALVRSDIPTRLTEAGRIALVDHGVRTVVDLRFPGEVEDDWHAYPFQDEESRAAVVRAHVPFNLGGDPDQMEQMHAAYRSATSRRELNRLDIDFNQIGIAAAVAAIADAAPGGVLVHCHAGKDRTGAVVALTLSVLGVSDEDIADDYALTALAIEPLIVDWLDQHSSTEEEREHLRMLATPVREAMLDTLAYMREKHWSAERFLTGGGMTDDQLKRLRKRMLEVS
jgi:protein tyrosine/serine phosphatase